MPLLKRIISRILPEKYAYNPRNISLHFHQFNQHLSQNDLGGAIQFYETLSSGEQTLLVEAVSEIVQDDTFFDAWFDDGNGPPLSALLRGAVLVKRAWFHRGGGRGEDVTQDKWQKMEAALDQAIESLKSILYDPVYGREANARCIRAAKGLGLSWDQLDILLENIRSNQKHHVFGEIDYLVASCKKWLGSDEKMFEHAFSAMAEYPGSAAMGCLLAAAHFERLFYIDHFEGDAALAAQYQSDQKILSEIRAASQRLLRKSEPGAPEHIFAHNVFACAFYNFDLHQDAKAHFLHIGEQITPYPWRYFFADDIQRAYTLAMRT